MLTRQETKKHGPGRLPRPVFAYGDPRTGLTSLAMALSMLGYRCCSDVLQLPRQEHRMLFERRTGRVFDAYVNVTSLADSYVKLADLYPGSKFIVTVASGAGEVRTATNSGPNEPSIRMRTQRATAAWDLTDRLSSLTGRLLVLRVTDPDKWERLCQFLDCGVPSSAYPNFPDIEPRGVVLDETVKNGLEVPSLSRNWDSLPWIVGPTRQWNGVMLSGAAESSSNGKNSITLDRMCPSIQQKHGPGRAQRRQPPHREDVIAG